MSGYEGEGTGGGWGSCDGGDAPGSGWAGKPGESLMAQATSQQNLTPLSDRADTRNQEGWNDANPTQTVGQIEASQRVGDALSWGMPLAMSALVPGYGLAMTLGKSGAKLMNGAPITDVVSDVLPGYINGKINQATGGLYGNVAKAGGILNSITGSPQVPNLGREIVGGIIGRPSGGTYAARPGTSAPNEGNGEATMAQQATPAPAAQPAAAQPSDIDFASLGIDSAGWTSAGRNYLEKRNGLV